MELPPRSGRLGIGAYANRDVAGMSLDYRHRFNRYTAAFARGSVHYDFHSKAAEWEAIAGLGVYF